MSNNEFPAMRLASWQATRDTMTVYSQLVGKIRRALTPKEKHWWHISLRAGATGLTTPPIPAGAEAEAHTFEMLLDFMRHQLVITNSLGEESTFELTDNDNGNDNGPHPLNPPLPIVRGGGSKKQELQISLIKTFPIYNLDLLVFLVVASQKGNSYEIKLTDNDQRQRQRQRQRPSPPCPLVHIGRGGERLISLVN